MRDLTFNTTKSSIQMSWFVPLFRTSLTLVYRILVINQTGGVVLNETTEATSYLLNNVTVCVIYNISIIAIEDGGYTSTVNKKVVYPDG